MNLEHFLEARLSPDHYLTRSKFAVHALQFLMLL